jgi:signal transduction histidine kinase
VKAYSYWLRGISILAFSFAFGQLGIRIHALSGGSPLIWAPSGVGLAALVIWGRHFWPWIFASGVLISASMGNPPAGSFTVGAGGAIGAWLGSCALEKLGSRQPTLSKVREVLVFVLLSTILSSWVSSALEVSGFYWSGTIQDDHLLSTWRTWWLGNAMGKLIVGGSLIAWHNDIRLRWKRLKIKRWDALGLALLVATYSALVFTKLGTHTQSLFVRPYLLFAVIMWAALRFDLLGATATSVAVVTCAIIGILQGYVAFATVPEPERMAMMQFFIATLASTGLVLAAAIREKLEAAEARSEFLGIASHELKTPITSLKLQLQMSQRRLSALPVKGPSELESLAFLGKVANQVNRLTQIVDQLLDVSRIERRDLALRLEETDLAALVSKLIERLSTDLASARCEVELDAQPGVSCRCDPFRIEQMLENLLSNAIKYAAGQKIRISIRMTDDGAAAIAVQDSGPGIDKAKLPYVFDRFVRANELPNIKGLGLGLFIARQIVEAHHGTISAQSEPTLGTKFEIRIPNATPAAAATAPVALATASSPSPSLSRSARRGSGPSP